MVVDDSAVTRGLLTRALESDPEISVVASVGDGQMAVAAIRRQDIEIVVLDIEMPVMDGLTALPQLIEARPGVQVLMASALTARGAVVSLKALSAGAADYVTKPGTSSLASATEFKRDVVAKVRALAQARRAARGEAQPAPDGGFDARTAPIRLRPMPGERPEAIAIGASTGGPQALLRLLKSVAGLWQPIFITQHMPATFTTALAEHITRLCGMCATEAVDGEPVESGRVYVAPGDFHMLVEENDGARRLRLARTPAENFCRPSLDPMLRSIACVYGRRALCAILTGMGQDGLKGSEALVAAGGAVIAQDEKTSVVWGMPGAVATAGLCSAVLPIDQLGPTIARLAARWAA
ncbi:MAG TPA: chemotaxis response regulator protein-glutamate methylesterase [Stellaceae bacterium]|nr:chemotaxis response regulator protein-glutamate methylesterase [Stellaceae bacterium]